MTQQGKAEPGDAEHKQHLKEARGRGLKLLARREHSTRELSLKLVKAGFSESVIDAVVGRLAAENLLSDRRFAELFAEQRFRKGYGELDIARKLGQRGIDRQLTRQAISTLVTEENVCWQTHALTVLCTRFGIEPDDPDTRAQAKEQRLREQWAKFLLRRGFPDHEVMRVLREFG